MRYALRQQAARIAVLTALLGVALAPDVAAAKLPSRIVSYAHVEDDGTLRIRNRRIRLYGIYIPPTSRICRTTIRPVRCAPRAANALDFKIQGFVECRPVYRHRDRSLTARCYNDGEDLGAYLIDRGWAVAAPGAPFEYTVLEDLARHHSRGIWGFNADVIRRAR